jgi:2-C-methyl-D-erythritol 4-phosphate cytidylyltransferase
MNYVVIFAGGVGTRMSAGTKPKQFLELNGKPIIIYTIEHFENHPAIEGIVVVCIESWIDTLKSMVEQANLHKVRWIVPGGATGQESIFRGLMVLSKHLGEQRDAVVLIHDGVRPLISAELISANIDAVLRFGSAITVTGSSETIVQIDGNGDVSNTINRDSAYMARAPQSFYLQNIYNAHLRAIADNELNMVDSACLMRHYGFPLHVVPGPVENIKITTPIDFYMSIAICKAHERGKAFDA